MKCTVIMPVHNGMAYLETSLRDLAASTLPPHEVIVVDDCSSDDTAGVARRFGARVITLDGSPRGPAVARNRGAETATGDILIFLDADVAAHPTTIERIVDHLKRNPEVVALFGSYDDRPTDPGIVSRYKNLLHHFTHQNSRRDASTFWAGCGAIRRTAFQEFGGFDETFRQPSIEDIDLGIRLKRAGHRIHSCPDIQATHLKRWSFSNLVHTDIFRRAIPWSRLIVRDGSMANDLNTNNASRYSAVAAWMLLLALLVGPWHPWAFIGAAPAIAILFACNVDFLRFLHRCGGIRFVSAASMLHILYFLYACFVFGVIAAERAVRVNLGLDRKSSNYAATRVEWNE